MTRFCALAFALLLAVLAGRAEAQDLTGTLKKIRDTGTITLGHRESSVPFSYYDGRQQPVGYAMDLCFRIVEAVLGATPARAATSSRRVAAKPFSTNSARAAAASSAGRASLRRWRDEAVVESMEISLTDRSVSNLCRSAAHVKK